jgi:hypothetical protein
METETVLDIVFGAEWATTAADDLTIDNSDGLVIEAVAESLIVTVQDKRPLAHVAVAQAVAELLRVPAAICAY